MPRARGRCHLFRSNSSSSCVGIRTLCGLFYVFWLSAHASAKDIDARNSATSGDIPRGCTEVAVVHGPTGDFGPNKPWAEAEQLLLNGHEADWEAWYDVSAALLQVATDQSWGLYATAARCLATALRLKPRGSAALYHLGYAFQKLRENAGKWWKWKAMNSFVLATWVDPTQTSFEGLAWFHIANNDAASAAKEYARGLQALCSPPGFGALPAGVVRTCEVSASYVMSWWDAVQQVCLFTDFQPSLNAATEVLENALAAAVSDGAPARRVGLPMAQAMRMPLLDSTRKRVAIQEIAALEVSPYGNQWRGYVHQEFPRSAYWLSALNTNGGPRKVRVGYLSFNFSPTRNLNGLVSGVFARHNREHFHVACFAIYGYHRGDTQAEMEQVHGEVDDFVNLMAASQGGGWPSDADMAAVINAKEVDVLVDLIGLIHNHRHGILALRPALTQVNMVYAATTGGDHIDIFVSDKIASPPELIPDVYVEKMLLVPGSHFVNNQQGLLSRSWAPPTRSEFGLPAGASLVAGLNAFFKITPLIFHAWMQILQIVPSAVLALAKYQYHAGASKNLKAAAIQEGVDPTRLLFLDKTSSLDDHIRRASLASVFLDTRLYNAHTLAVDILWAGVPLVTWPETTLASRVSASLLGASGLGATVARSSNDYVALASIFASQGPAAMAHQAILDTRSKFKALRDGGDIFHVSALVRRLERGFRMGVDVQIADGGARKHLVVSDPLQR